jgi:cytochrome c biogenesis protein CcmG, thiol:disulfide interchange protein DsbE
VSWPPSPRARRVLEALLWTAVLGFAGYRLWPQLAAALAVGGPREEAPAFEVRTLEGERLALEELRGQVILVNFWATWCPPCRVEMPGFERVYRERREDGFVIVGLSADRTGAEGVRRFLEERDITFPVALDHGAIARDFGGVRGLPTSFLIDRQGRIRHVVVGLFAAPGLRTAVDRLLAEPDPTGAEEPAPRPEAARLEALTPARERERDHA